MCAGCRKREGCTWCRGGVRRCEEDDEGSAGVQGLLLWSCAWDWERSGERGGFGKRGFGVREKRVWRGKEGLDDGGGRGQRAMRASERDREIDLGRDSEREQARERQRARVREIADSSRSERKE